MSLNAKRPSKNLKDQLLQEVQDTKEPTKRLNTDIEASLYRRIKSQAVIEDRSISEITRELWLDYLARND